jgi:hypothetical protein
MKTIAAVTLVLLTASAVPSFAETMLYLNKDNKSWTMAKTFAFPEDCDKAARSAMRNKEAFGAGCAPYSTAAFAPQRQPQSSGPQRQQQRTSPAGSQPGSAPRQGKTQDEIMNDKDVKYRQRVYDSAVEAAKGQSGQAVYSNGNSYAGQNIQDAAANLQKAIDKASK